MSFNHSNTLLKSSTLMNRIIVGRNNLLKDIQLDSIFDLQFYILLLLKVINKLVQKNTDDIQFSLVLAFYEISYFFCVFD